MFKYFGRTAGYLLLCLWFPLLVSAQSARRASISAPLPDGFPRITAYLDVRDDQGAFVSGLQAGEITALEDGVPLPVEHVLESEVGVQAVVVVNEATPFGIRDEKGNSRFDYIQEDIQAWAASTEPSGEDTLSLVTPEGAPVSFEPDRAKWLAALEAYAPDFKLANPSLDGLARGISMAAEATPRPGMQRAVLFLTPTLNPVFNNGLRALAEQANEAGVHVFVWLVDSPLLYDSPEAEDLRLLAELTGGKLDKFLGAEKHLDFQVVFDMLRDAYVVSYQSVLTTAGVHELAMVIQKDGWEVAAPGRAFEVHVQAPKPILVSPPSQIVRAAPENGEGENEMQPSEQTIEVIIEFPDSFVRPLASTRLYVNGIVVAENTKAPFDQFTWDLSAYEVSERVYIAVVAEDHLGMSGVTIETPVQVTVQRPPQGLDQLYAKFGSTMAAVAVGVAGIVLILVLVLAGRIQPRQLGKRRRKKRSAGDPVTQPIDALPQAKYDEPASKLAQFARRVSSPGQAWSQKRFASQAPAYLTPVDHSGESMPGKVLPMTAEEMTFGRDAVRVTVRLDDPALEDVHARLWQDAEGKFWLADSESVAGTWLNFAPVSASGCRIEHGDLIHFGRVGYRFTLTNPEKERRPVVIREGDKI
ncbi:MAG: FHA domain-containing protein [Anaerolineae bacterium]|nr:FHA domain-containing protein [Anaerolineae bacterium]